MKQFGLKGISLPAEYGGSDFDTVDYSAAVMELAKVDAPVAITTVSHTSLGTPPSFLFRRERLKKKYLLKVASGEALLALGLTEPPASSDKKSVGIVVIRIGQKYLTISYISIGALLVITAKAAYQKAMVYSKDRIAFGKPINHFQSNSFILTYMATKIEATKLLVYQGVWLKDRREDFTNKATMVKFYASEADMEIAWEAILIHGGYHYVNEYDVERFFRESKTLEIVEGTSEIQRLTISREIFKDKMTS